MKRYVALALLLSVAANGQTPADAPAKMHPKPNDFAMQLPLQISGNNGVVQVRLPLSVYQHAQSSQLADVRVFNPAGQPVPFAFYQPSASAKINWRESDVKLFPVLSDTADELGGQIELDVRAAQDGALLSVHTKSLGKHKGNLLTALVLDLDKARAGETLDSLQLFLPGITTSYRANLAIEQSDDLKLWDRVAQSRVDWLQGATQSSTLVNDRIELSPRTGRYARIHWLEGKPLQFSRIAARWRSSEAPINDALELVLKATPGKVAGDWAYASSAAIAATEIGLNLPNANTVMPVSIGFYHQQLTPTRKWLFDAIIHNTFYRLNQNGAERVSSRLHIAPQANVANAEWVVRPQTTSAAAPELVLRWHPHTIAFTAQSSGTGVDQGTFTLAFGASADDLKQWLTSESPISQVAPGFSTTDLNQLEHASIGQVFATPATENHASASAESTTTKINKRTLLLWAVLIFGTLLLGGMSWRLYKQMNNDKQT